MENSLATHVSTHAQVMQGAALYAELLKGDAIVLASFLRTQENPTQSNIALFLFWQGTGRQPSGPLDFEQVKESLAFMQKFIRQGIEEAARAPIVNETEIKRLRLQAIAEKQKRAHQPHVLGTVAEIATRFGISKSEVRRLKTEGKLYTLTEKEPTP